MSEIGMLSLASRRARTNCAARAAHLKGAIRALEKTIKRVGRLAPDMPDVPCLPLCEDADEAHALACAAHVAAILMMTVALVALRKKEEDGWKADSNIETVERNDIFESE